MARVRSTPESEAWRSILVAFTQLSDVLGSEMSEATGLPLERYEILLMLASADDGSMRPSELAERRHLSRSGATRLVDRLTRDGLVERRRCDEDGRGSLVALTDAGRDAFRTAGRVHLRGIERHVGAHLGAGELAELTRLLRRVVGGLARETNPG